LTVEGVGEIKRRENPVPVQWGKGKEEPGTGVILYS
jgi:hypothetical protein